MMILLGIQKAGAVQCFDIFLDGQWHGSRRTEAQCEDQMHRKADICMVRSVDGGVLGSEVAEAVRVASAVHRPGD